MPDILLSASILSADFARLGEEIDAAEAGGVDWIHVDVMDGQFVPNLSMGPFVVETCRRISKLPLDVHLMIETPDRIVPAFARAGASILSVHIENTPHIHRVLSEIHAAGCKAGVVLNPGTPAHSISAVLPLVDQVLVMTVDPGYSGQAFQPETVAKIAEVRQMLDQIQSPAVLQVDGGITPETLPQVYAAGARCCVAATAIFKHPAGISAGIQALRRAIA